MAGSLVVNGHVYPAVDSITSGARVSPSRLCSFTILRMGNLSASAPRLTVLLRPPGPCRGWPLVIWMGDGRLDVVINNLDSKPSILETWLHRPDTGLNVRLVGDTIKKTPKDAIGSNRLFDHAKAATKTRRDKRRSLLFTNDMTLHFGLERRRRSTNSEIQWANGDVEAFDIPAIDKKRHYRSR